MLVFSETGILPIRRYQKMHITEVMGYFALHCIWQRLACSS